MSGYDHTGLDVDNDGAHNVYDDPDDDSLDELVNRLNDLNDAFNLYVTKHDDRPDVEFNDDGSVHINTPGDYDFRSTNHAVTAWKHRDDGNRSWRHYNWRGWQYV